MIFRDPYGKTRLSGRKTLLFCAYNQFFIPHDIAGAILYSDVLDGLSELDFDSDLFRICDPSLVSFFDDADWYLAALHSMGHGDIADEFKDLNDKVRKYVKNNYGKMPHDELKTRILGMLPQKYICKKN